MRRRDRRLRALVRRTALAGGAAGGLVLAAVGGLAYQLFRRPLPKRRGTLAVPGLDGTVEIRRDRWAVPHIRAETEHDLWFGQGFCHGQDRLWQMDIHRRIGRGRLAEIVGPEALPVDRLFRTLGIAADAERQVERLDPVVREALEAYSAGVNAAADAAAALPVEFQLLRIGFEPWQPADSEALGKLLAFGLSTNWESELLRADMARELGPEVAARLDPRYPVGNPVATHPGQGFDGDALGMAEQIERIKASIGLAPQKAGSNNWAVSGARSATGGPLLAGDPHLHPAIPSVWYQQGLEWGDRFARGAVTPGTPGIMLGQNNDVAFSNTNVMPDVMDLFVERIDGDRYLFEDEWLPLETEVEEIPVKGREPVSHEIRRTHHGPLVNEALGCDDDPPLALLWSGIGEPATIRVQTEPWLPTSGDELVRYAGDLTTPASNLVWADRHGSIGYKMIGKLPVRKGACPDLPKPGWTGEYEWDGWVPYEEMPETRDPEEGYLVTANNMIAAAEDFPHHITSETYDGYRAGRIEDLIRSREAHDLDSFEAMQTDLHSNIGVEVARRLSRLEPARQRERAAVELLRSWNGDLGPDSVAGTIYQAFTLRLAREFCRAVIRDRDLSDRYLNRSMTAFLNHITSPWRWQSHLMDMWAEGDDELIGRPWNDLVLDALRGALDELTDRFGPDVERWRWGEIHRVEFAHSLGTNPALSLLLNRHERLGGNQETVAQTSYDPNDPFAAVTVPGWRMVADVERPELSRWQGSTGQSGQPGSGHYDDLIPGWSAGTTQRMAGDGPWSVLTLEPS